MKCKACHKRVQKNSGWGGYYWSCGNTACVKAGRIIKTESYKGKTIHA